MFDVIRGTAIDYMHCVCEGVVEQLLNSWFSQEKKDKLYFIGNKIEEIDSELLSIQPVSEITRTTRSIYSSHCRPMLYVKHLGNRPCAQFERYSIWYLPKFISVNELKQYLLENYSEELSPTSNCTSLTISYMSDGRWKCDIKTEKQLDNAYRSVKNGWITLWVDPHSSFKRKQGEIERREASKAKRKRNSGMNGKPYCLSFPLVTKLLNV